MRRLRRRRKPSSQGQPNDLRLWDIRAAITTGIAAAIAGLAILTLIAWLLLHQPGLPDAKSISLHDSISVLQLVFASVAGAGALVGLIVAYRRQKVAEADSAHDRTRVYNERFTTIATQLGEDKPAVRLAGIHALAGLADDWEANRQTCINVLCAYLRMPYEPDPGSEAPAAQQLAFLADREVRHTVIRVIAEHLQADAITPWHNQNFDFTGTIFDGGDFSDIVLSGGAVSFKNTRFGSGEVDFGGVQFCGSTVDFTFAEFSGGDVNFSASRISDGVVSFGAAQFSSGEVNFIGVRFSGGSISFSNAQFTGGEVNFGGSQFAGGTAFFVGTQFLGSAVNFTYTEFCDCVVTFSDAEFSNGTVSFTKSQLFSGEVIFTGARFSGADVGFTGAQFRGANVSFARVQFSGGDISFEDAQFSGGGLQFARAEFTDGVVSFVDSEFSGGTVDLRAVISWSKPPRFSQPTSPAMLLPPDHYDQGERAEPPEPL